MEPGFCKKHERDKYYLEEKEKGIRFCDIARGCFKLCAKDYASCQECLDKTRIVDSARYQKRKEIIKAIQITKPNSLCAYCGKDFEPFQTRYNKDSVSCKPCSENQAKQDEKRKGRDRNYKNENSKNLKRYYKGYIKGATERGFDITIDFEIFSELVKSPCHYCGNSTPEEVNGVDRVNNAVGYTKENCVSSCWTCNRMKHAYHKNFFLHKCHIMISKKKASPEFFTKWQMYYYRSSYKQFGAYKKEAEARGLKFNLTEDEWTKMTRCKCYLCGYQSPKGIGIDRLDNTDRTYTRTNCRPCCGSCNDMKGEHTIAELMAQCSRIVNAWPAPPEDVPENLLKDYIANGGERHNDRTHWKSNGLYYAILTDSAEGFYELFSDVMDLNEFDRLCEEIKGTEKGLAVERLQKLIRALKQRRIRLSVTVSSKPQEIPLTAQKR
jgi:hypothetical protein